MDKVHEIGFSKNFSQRRNTFVPLSNASRRHCPPATPVAIVEWRWENPSSFLLASPREEIPAMVRRTASKNAFKNSGETPVGMKGGRREDRKGCIRNSTYNHRVEMHRDGESTSGFNRIEPRIGGPVATLCRRSLRHSDRMQERASSRVLVVIIALKPLSHRLTTSLRSKNFLLNFHGSSLKAIIGFYQIYRTRA